MPSLCRAAARVGMSRHGAPRARTLDARSPVLLRCCGARRCRSQYVEVPSRPRACRRTSRCFERAAVPLRHGVILPPDKRVRCRRCSLRRRRARARQLVDVAAAPRLPTPPPLFAGLRPSVARRLPHRYRAPYTCYAPAPRGPRCPPFILRRCVVMLDTTLLRVTPVAAGRRNKSLYMMSRRHAAARRHDAQASGVSTR